MAEFIRCYMRFEYMLGTWRVDVTRDGRPVRSLSFEDESKIEAMARRGNGIRNSESRNMLELGIRNRCGAIELYLTPEQFAKLKR